jgi:hypothetical protein
VDGETEEGQQTKGDEMTLGDFMDVLGKLHKLTPAQRRAVAEVLAEVPELETKTKNHTRKQSAARPENDGQNYSDQEATIFDAVAKDWGPKPAAVRREVIKRLATQMGRTKDAIKYQINERIK